jgi:protein-S-isoprenylcysteine O-methyltransferase Ste14
MQQYHVQRHSVCCAHYLYMLLMLPLLTATCVCVYVCLYMPYMSCVVCFFTYIGIPMLEDKANAEHGDSAAYKQYKENTPILVPYLHLPIPGVPR